MDEGGKSRSILITPNRQYFLFSADQVINIVFWINSDVFCDHEALLILCIRCNWDSNRKKWEEPSWKAEPPFPVSDERLPRVLVACLLLMFRHPLAIPWPLFSLYYSPSFTESWSEIYLTSICITLKRVKWLLISFYQKNALKYRYVICLLQPEEVLSGYTLKVFCEVKS